MSLRISICLHQVRLHGRSVHVFGERDRRLGKQEAVDRERRLGDPELLRHASLPRQIGRQGAMKDRLLLSVDTARPAVLDYLLETLSQRREEDGGFVETDADHRLRIVRPHMRDSDRRRNGYGCRWRGRDAPRLASSG